MTRWNRTTSVLYLETMQQHQKVMHDLHAFNLVKCPTTLARRDVVICARDYMARCDWLQHYKSTTNPQHLYMSRCCDGFVVGLRFVADLL